LNRDSKSVDAPQTIEGSNAPSRARKEIVENDVLVSMTRPNLNAVALVPKTLSGQIASTGFEVLRPSGIVPSLCLSVVRSQAFIDDMCARVQGALYPAVNSNDVRSFRFALASLAEQKVIADKLDALLAQVDTLQKRLNAIPAILKRFRQSVLSAAVSGRLTEEWQRSHAISPWQSLQMSQVIDGLSQGWSPKCEGEATENPEEWAVIKTTAIQHLRFDGRENKRLPKSLQPRPDHIINVGDILITRAGPRIRVGVCSLVKAVKPRLMLCDKAYRFRAKRSVAKPEYLEIFLNAPETVNEINGMKSGISESGVNLTQDGFAVISISIPSLPEQTEIVRRVESLFAFADQIEARVQEATARVKHLTQSILAKAFRGELTEEWRQTHPELVSGENSAAALLERIRVARAAVPDVKGKRGRKA
jgi:type I restriction enzyme S subunit